MMSRLNSSIFSAPDQAAAPSTKEIYAQKLPAPRLAKTKKNQNSELVNDIVDVLVNDPPQETASTPLPEDAIKEEEYSSQINISVDNQNNSIQVGGEIVAEDQSETADAVIDLDQVQG